MGLSLDRKRWVRVDLHIHTPASEDYAEPNATFLDILREAERRGLELIAFTDHNTVAGYERMRREIDFLEQLERTDRATPIDRQQLDEYYRLLHRIVVLPGFEFTSHYGAHVLGIFAPMTPISLIEATLLQLGVPADKLKAGTTAIPGTKHVTDAYEGIAKVGGIVIAAHVNGPGGVITETLRMGTSGQARIAATQSSYLHALEFVNFYTDHGIFTNPGFYNGKTEHYERPMFCIQGSDAHRIRRAPAAMDATYKHGIGDRYFEVLLAEPSFEALRELFQTRNFDHVRVPKRDQKQWEIDQLRFGQETERQLLRSQADDPQRLVYDIAALCNAGGGTLIIGAGEQMPGRVEGVAHPDQVATHLRTAVEQQLEPLPALSFELLHYEGHDVMRIEVNAPRLPPYVTQDGVVYVRRGSETVPASRSEIIQLARRALAGGATSPLDNGQELELPRSGVEVVSAERRNGEWLYEIRDLRTTPGVSRERAQGLWQYAISRQEDIREGRIDLYSQTKWVGRLGLLRAYQAAGRIKYDLVHRDANGVIDHIFYGVSDWGLGGAWSALLNDTRSLDQQPPDPRLAAAESEPDDHNDLPEQATRVVPTPEALSLMQSQAAGTPGTEMRSSTFGGRRWRWRGRGGIWRIGRDPNGAPLFDLALKQEGSDTPQQFHNVSYEKLSDTWRRFMRVASPRTGIEVISDSHDENGVRWISFRDLRTGEISAPWRAVDLKEGSVREYAARMQCVDVPLDEAEVRWWGNLGYLRPMRSQVDLVYRDENGVDHIYYAARRDELRGEWAELLAEWESEAEQHNDMSGAIRANGHDPAQSRGELPHRSSPRLASSDRQLLVERQVGAGSPAPTIQPELVDTRAAASAQAASPEINEQTKDDSTWAPEDALSDDLTEHLGNGPDDNAS